MAKRSSQKNGNPLPINHLEKRSVGDPIKGGLQAKDGALKGFVIAGEDRQWKPASARIVDDKVIVSSPEVKQPVEVRYAWEADPICNLNNGAGLPASPFRMDTWATN